MIKMIGNSNYKYVTQIKMSGTGIWWRGTMNGNGKNFRTEREAAIYVDKKLIEKGKNPINILKKK